MQNIMFIYVCHDVFYAGGEQLLYIYMLYLFSAGGVCVHNLSSSKRGKCWNLDFDDNNCDAGTL